MANSLSLRFFLIVVLLGIAIACAMVGGPTNGLDVTLIYDGIAARQATPLATDAGVVLNYVGGASATIGLALLLVGLLVARRKYRSAAWLCGIVTGGRLLVEAIKLLVHRARPALDPHPVLTHSLSFPSAHASNSMIVLPALVLFFVAPGRRTAAMMLAIAASLVIGTSRSLIGVHWPSDVLAGWSIGAAWLIAAWSVAERSVSNELHHDVVGGHLAALDGA